MKNLAPLIPLLLVSAACARTEAVSDDELETIEVAPTPDLADLEVADDGPDALPVSAMEWRAVGDAVQLGETRDQPALEIACDTGDQGIVLTRYGVEGDGSAGTLTIVGNGASARVPVVAADGAQEGEFNWTATLARGELASNIRTAFQPDAPVNITATGTAPIVVAPATPVRDLLDRCVGEEGERAAGEGEDVEALIEEAEASVSG